METDSAVLKGDSISDVKGGRKPDAAAQRERVSKLKDRQRTLVGELKKAREEVSKHFWGLKRTRAPSYYYDMMLLFLQCAF